MSVLECDPEPYVTRFVGRFPYGDDETTFEPRPEYSQDRRDYRSQLAIEAKSALNAYAEGIGTMRAFKAATKRLKDFDAKESHP